MRANPEDPASLLEVRMTRLMLPACHLKKLLTSVRPFRRAIRDNGQRTLRKFVSLATSAFRGTKSRKVAWLATLATPASYIFVLFVLPYVLAFKLLPPSLLRPLAIIAPVIAIAATAMVISRRYLIAFSCNAACLLLITGLALSLELVMAAFSGHSHRHAQRVINANELVGEWEPTEQTLHFLFFSKRYYRTYEPHFLSLKADGAVVFASFIDSTGDPAQRFDYLQAVGTWTLQQLDPHKEFSHNRLELELEGPRYRRGASFYIMDRGGELTLWQSIGDPFAWDYLEYKRSDPIKDVGSL